MVCPKLPSFLGRGVHRRRCRLGGGLRAGPGLPQSPSPSAQVSRTCRDGFRGAREKTSWSWSWSLAPSPPPPLPKPSAALAAVAPRRSLAAAPAQARSTLWLSAMRRLGILQQSPGGLGRESGLPLPSTAPSPWIKPRRQEKKCQVSVVSVVPGVTETGLLHPHLSWLTIVTSLRAITHSSLCPGTEPQALALAMNGP